MIQFNLLPDVKINYIRAKRVKRLITVTSLLIIGFSLFVTASIATNVFVIQRRHISNINEDIQSYTQQIEAVEEVNRILTVQNQLRTITQLHDQKPVVSRLFSFIETITPSNISMSRLNVDLERDTMVITGQGSDLATVNKFVDTLKFTQYQFVDETEEDELQLIGVAEEKAFQDVVLSSFNRGPDEVTFRIELVFLPIIFDSQDEVVLIVPEQITTRSELERPQALFQQPQNGAQ